MIYGDDKWTKITNSPEYSTISYGLENFLHAVRIFSLDAVSSSSLSFLARYFNYASLLSGYNIALPRPQNPPRGIMYSPGDKRPNDGTCQSSTNE